MVLLSEFNLGQPAGRRAALVALVSGQLSDADEAAMMPQLNEGERNAVDIGRAAFHASEAHAALVASSAPPAAVPSAADAVLPRLIEVLDKLSTSLSTPSTGGAAVSDAAPAPSPAAGPREPTVRVREPSTFDGRHKDFPLFLADCERSFALAPTQFAKDSVKISYVASFFDKAPRKWFGAAKLHAELAVDSGNAEKLAAAKPTIDLLNNWKLFRKEFARHFSDPFIVDTNARQLDALRQGERACSAYAADFQSLAYVVPLNDYGLVEKFYRGLRPSIKDRISEEGRAATFPDLMSQAMRIDERQTARRLESAEEARLAKALAPSSSYTSPSSGDKNTSTASGTDKSSPSSTTEPTSKRISPEERERRMREGLCRACGLPGHFSKDCTPEFRKAGAASSTPPASGNGLPSR